LPTIDTTLWLRSWVSQCIADDPDCLSHRAGWLLLAAGTLNVAWFWALSHRRARVLCQLALWPTLGALLALLRMRALLAPELNPDEGQNLAEALTYANDASFWAAADGHSHGPFAPLLLLSTRLLGLPLDYTTARLVTLGVILVAAALTGSLSARFLGREVKLFAATACVLGLGSVVHFDMRAFNAEYAGILLGLLATLGIVSLTDARSFRRLRIVGVGAALAMLPFAKLQVAPLALALFALALLSLRYASAPIVESAPWELGSAKQRRQEVLLLVAAVATWGLGFLGYVAARGGLSHFVDCYIRYNLLYADVSTFARGEWVGYLDRLSATLGAPFWWFVLLIGIVASQGRAEARRVPALVWAAALAVTAVLLYSVHRPGRPLEHYLTLVVFPLAILMGLLAAQAVVATRYKALTAALLLLSLGPASTHALLGGKPIPARPSFSAREQRVANLIAQFSQPGETVGVWGWMCRFFVLSGRGSATRHPHAEHEMQGAGTDVQVRGSVNQSNQAARAVYMADLRTRRPPVIVDAVAPWSFRYTNRRQSGHERFPELAALVARDYQLVEDVEGVRVYVARQRLQGADRVPVQLESSVREGSCLVAGGVGQPLGLGRCTGSGWLAQREGGFYSLRDPGQGLCLSSMHPGIPGSSLTTEPCAPGQANQRWTLVQGGQGLRIATYEGTTCASLREDGRLTLDDCAAAEAWRSPPLFAREPQG
jgi:hypothetical protein